MTKYSIVLIKWDILNKDGIGKKLCKKKVIMENEEFSGIYY